MTRRTGLAVGAALVLVAAGLSARLLLGDSGGGRTATLALPLPPRVPTPNAPTFPAPPRGAVVFSGSAGRYAVGLAAVPVAGGLGLKVSLATVEGTVPPGLPVELELEDRDGTSHAIEPGSCGTGCYRTVVATEAPPARVAVRLTYPPATLSFPMPRQWPARDAAALVTKVERAWRAARTALFHETASTAGSRPLRSTYVIVAPDRLSAAADDGSAAKIIIGNRAWVRQGSAAWRQYPQVPIHQLVPFWTSAADSHMLGPRLVGGHPAWRISFFDPGTPGWFTIDVDRRTFLPYNVRLIAAQHFLTYAFGRFDAPRSILPPGTAR